MESYIRASVFREGIEKVYLGELFMRATNDEWEIKTIMLVFGTRPESIKMCPLIKELKARAVFRTLVCVTGQHRKMLDQVLETFGVVPDYDLSIMKSKQTLFDITIGILENIKLIIDRFPYRRL